MHYVDLSCIKAVHMSPALSRNSALQCFKCDKYEQNNVSFLPGTATLACRKIQPQA